MKIVLIISQLILFYPTLFAQNVGIGTTGPAGKLQVNHRSAVQPGILLVDSTPLQSGLIRFRNVNSSKFIEARGYSGSPVSSAEHYLDIQSDTAFIATFRGNGNVGINNLTPAERLDVNGNINVTGTIKANGAPGLPNQLLGTNETGSLAWVDRTGGTGAGNVGFGSWGDCSMNNISEYLPVTDTGGASIEYFGNSVSMSGNFALVGASNDKINGEVRHGSASAYYYNGSNWVFTQTLTDATGAAFDDFGACVSVSGSFAIIGAPGDMWAATPPRAP